MRTETVLTALSFPFLFDGPHQTIPNDLELHTTITTISTELFFAPPSPTSTTDVVTTTGLLLFPPDSIHEPQLPHSTLLLYPTTLPEDENSRTTVTQTQTTTLTTTTTTTQIQTQTQTITLSPLPTSSPNPTPVLETAWTLPTHFTNVSSAFKIKKFAVGRDNLRLVTEIPKSAYGDASMSSREGNGLGSGFARYVKRVSMVIRSVSRSIFGSLSDDGFDDDIDDGHTDEGNTNPSNSSQNPIPNPTSNPPTTNESTLLRITYPLGSINPGNPSTPTGGSTFYSSPLSPHLLSQARNVSLEYSVFFPVGFDWVKGTFRCGFI